VGGGGGCQEANIGVPSGGASGTPHKLRGVKYRGVKYRGVKGRQVGKSKLRGVKLRGVMLRGVKDSIVDLLRDIT